MMRYPIHAEDRGAQCAAPFDLVQATYEFSGKEYLEDAAHFFSIDIPAVLIELSRSNIAIEDDDIDLRDRISNKRFTVVVSGPGFEDTDNAYASLEDANRVASYLRAESQDAVQLLSTPRPEDGYVLFLCQNA